MTFEHVDRPDRVGPLEAALEGAERLALDCEAAGFHRYSDRLCLVQLTVGDETFVVDPFAVDVGPLLRPVLEDPSVEVLMHGADFDLRLLRRDLDIGLRGLFDSQIAASLLGESSIGLQALLESRLGVEVSKKYQRADWAVRPLEPGMLEYAAGDTRHLEQLCDGLRAELESVGRLDWVLEECRLLEEVAGAPNEGSEEDDPVTRVKGARSLSPREVAALREALGWRDEIARERDRAPFRVVGDKPLLQVALTRPRHAGALSDIKGFPKGLARGQGDDLIRRLDAVERLDESKLRPYPPPSRRGPGRPPPELEEVVDRLKAVRNGRAEELGLDRGTLLSNSVLLEIARAGPRDEKLLGTVDGLRTWQVEVVGPALLEALRKAG